MRRTTPTRLAWVALAVSAATATVRAQPTTTAATATTPKPAGPYLATHRIDRFEAIRQVREALAKDPRNLNDWIILGELAQEVAADVPAELAAGYDKLARASYESALRLRPGDANLKAAAEFARDQEQGEARLSQSRARAAGAYLAARRRELAATGAGPTVRVYAAPGAAAGAPYYTYQPYATAGGTPYTYQQYAGAQETPAGLPVESNHPVGATERAALVKPAAAMAPP